MDGKNDLDIRNFQVYQSLSDDDRLLLVIAQTGGDGSISIALLRSMLTDAIKPAIQNGVWHIGPVDTGVVAEGRTPTFRLSELGVEYHYAESEPWVLLIPIDQLKLHFTDLTAEDKLEIKGENVYLQKTETHIQWKIGETGEWQNLVELKALKGDKGDAGRNPEFRTGSSGIEWRLASKVGSPEDSWKLLVPYDKLKLTFDMLSSSQKEEIRGYSSYQLWQMEPGNAGKSYDDYKAYLKKEVIDAAAKCDEGERYRTRTEGVRQVNEQNRELAEHDRVTNEDGRKTAESTRATQESGRVTQFGQIKTEWTKISKECETTTAETKELNVTAQEAINNVNAALLKVESVRVVVSPTPEVTI